MGKKLYVGNLPYSINDDALMDHFSSCGTVESSRVIVDRESGRSKGFGFVEMSSDDEAQQAIERFDGAELEGRPLKVNEARPPRPREDRGRGGPGRERW